MMHYFIMRVVSTRRETQSSAPSQAYVSCWINDANRENALSRAMDLVGGEGWTVTEVVEDCPISREDYSKKTEGLEYYEQALIDGEVVVFFVPKRL